MAKYPRCPYCHTYHKQCANTRFEAEGLQLEEMPLREQKLVIPCRLDGLNELIEAARSHWSRGAKQKAEQEEIISLSIMAARLKPIPGPFKMKIHYAEPNTARDPDNIVSAKKYILDALQKMKIIPNDSQKYVLGFEESWGLATKDMPEGVHIKLIEEI